MTPHELGKKAIEKFNKRITVEIFLVIQNERELMQQYLRLVESNGLGTVNRSIGKEIKKAYALTNIDDREDDPSCTLIKSHQKFE